MKIGVKFCGGCNPRYDRAALLASIRELCSEHIHYTKTGEEYDLLLVINGCTSKCCNIAGIRSSNSLWIDPSSTLESVLDEISKIMRG